MTNPDEKTLAALNVRIAELTGWKWEGGSRNKRLKSQRFIAPDFKAAVTMWRDGMIGGSGMPNFTGSLDAIHGAIAKLITPDLSTRWLREFDRLVMFGANPHWPREFHLSNAAAWLHAVAIDRTISKTPII